MKALSVHSRLEPLLNDGPISAEAAADSQVANLAAAQSEPASENSFLHKTDPIEKPKHFYISGMNKIFASIDRKVLVEMLQ